MITTAANIARRAYRSNPLITMSDLVNYVAAESGTTRDVAARAVQIAFPAR